VNRALVFCLGVTIGIMASYLVWHPASSYATPRSAQLVPVPPAALSGAPSGCDARLCAADPAQLDGASLNSGIGQRFATDDERSAIVAAPLIVTGQATWYGTGPGRGHAAAGSELRTGDWRGRHAEVCHGDRCVRVVLDDWCACGGARIIDLSDEDFARLAPLSTGVISVTVTSGSGAPAPVPTAPATDISP
jgi:hypothetical protein